MPSTQIQPTSFDPFQLVRTAANSVWTRPVLCALAAPHFAYFTTIWLSLGWLCACLALEALFQHARAKALQGSARWRFVLVTAVIAATSPQPDRRILIGNMAPPVPTACAMLSASYIEAIPVEILPFALCSALGIAVTMFGAA